jgi:hypothetical protein
MSRRARSSPRAERLAKLLASGDHRAARAEARAALRDADTPREERDAAAGVLASLAPERSAIVAGAIGVAVALAIAIATLVRG